MSESVDVSGEGAISRVQLQNKVEKLKRQLRQITSPPLISGIVTEVIGSEKAEVRTEGRRKFIVTIPKNVDNDDLNIGTRVGLNPKNMSLIKVFPASKDRLVRKMEVEESPNVSYDDVGGLKEQVESVRESVELSLKRDDFFEEVGVEPPKGILFHGPPGTGKTLLARAVANETNATFMRLVGSELVKKYLGEGGRLVREVFELAREKSPSIIFIDEVDVIGTKRETSTATVSNREVQRTLMQLLNEMDGFEPRGDVRIIGATNRIDMLDRAILRPGRFDRLVEFPKPDETARREIFEVHTRDMSLDEDINFERLAEKTEDTTGADINAICNEAGTIAVKNGRKKVNYSDFKEAVSKVETEKDKRQPGVMYC